MEWYHVLGMVIGNLAVILPIWLWARAESRSDMRHMDSKFDSQRNLFFEMQKETQNLINAIHLEMKDFHHRLCSIEERNRK